MFHKCVITFKTCDCRRRKQTIFLFSVRFWNPISPFPKSIIFPILSIYEHSMPSPSSSLTGLTYSQVD